MARIALLTYAGSSGLRESIVRGNRRFGWLYTHWSPFPLASLEAGLAE